MPRLVLVYLAVIMSYHGGQYEIAGIACAKLDDVLERLKDDVQFLKFLDGTGNPNTKKIGVVKKKIAE